MRGISTRRQGWKKDYNNVLKAWSPDECARCGRSGDGWVNFGGDLEPHHPYGRRTRATMCIVFPFCSSCHIDWAHNNTVKAKEDGWIIPRTRCKFDRDVMDAKIEAMSSSAGDQSDP